MTPAMARGWISPLLALVLNGCISVPDDTWNQQEARVLEMRGWEPDFDGVRQDELENHVREEINAPIEFHGLVFDDQGEPIAGLPVKVTLFDEIIQPFRSPYFGWTNLHNVQTDAKGRFQVSGRTGAALIVSVTSADYWDVDEHRAQRVYYYSDFRRAQNKHPLPLTSSAPATFQLKPKPEEAKTELIRMGSITLPIGEEIGLSLGRPRHPVDAELADLLVTLKMDEPDSEDRYNWQLQVRVPGGGIQRVHTLFTDQAPAEGYQQGLRFGSSAGAGNWSHREELLCFMRTADGNFAAVTLRVRTRGQPFINVTGKINPHGLRYLD